MSGFWFCSLLLRLLVNIDIRHETVPCNADCMSDWHHNSDNISLKQKHIKQTACVSQKVSIFCSSLHFNTEHQKFAQCMQVTVSASWTRSLLGIDTWLKPMSLRFRICNYECLSESTHRNLFNDACVAGHLQHIGFKEPVLITFAHA